MPKSIIHMLTPEAQVSPFDFNMAVDGGFDHINPMTSVKAADDAGFAALVKGFTEDAIFSRKPNWGRNTALFFGGRDVSWAIAMQEVAKASMTSGFAVNTMSDPSGSLTTASALIAHVEAALIAVGDTLRGQNVAVFGAGAVGSTVAALAAMEGATVLLADHDGSGWIEKVAARLQREFGVVVKGYSTATPQGRADLLAKSSVVVACGPAGRQILSKADMAASGRIMVAADVNAVAPLGIEGVGIMDNGQVINDMGTSTIGALAIGRTKSDTQRALLASMLAPDTVRHIGLAESMDMARTILAARKL